MHAAQWGHTSVVQVLLERQAQVNVQDNHRNTALHHAATQGHTHTVKELIRCKADQNIKNHVGATAMANAILGGRRESSDALQDSCLQQ